MNKSAWEIKKAPVCLLLLTPAIAKEFLENNLDGNRNVRKNKVEEYVEQINQGEWNPLTGDLLRITKDGVLIDGQHRCHAVVKSGNPAWVLFCDEFQERDYKKVDAGMSRKASDAVGDTNTAALASFLIRSKQQTLNATFNAAGRRLANSEVAQFAEKHRKAISSALAHGERCYVTNGRGGRSAYGWAWLAFHSIDDECAKRFFEELESEIVLTRMFSVFRRRIAKIGAERGTRAFLSSKALFQLLFPLWNAYSEGRDLARIEAQEDLFLNGYTQGQAMNFVEKIDTGA